MLTGTGQGLFVRFQHLHIVVHIAVVLNLTGRPEQGLQKRTAHFGDEHLQGIHRIPELAE